MEKKLHYQLYNDGNCGLCNLIMSVETAILMAELTGRTLYIYHNQPIFNSDRGECIQDIFPDVKATFRRGDVANYLEGDFVRMPEFIGNVFYYDYYEPDPLIKRDWSCVPGEEFRDGRVPWNLAAANSIENLITASHQTLSQYYYQVFVKPELRIGLYKKVADSFSGVSVSIVNHTHTIKKSVASRLNMDGSFDCLHVRRGDYLQVAGTRGGQLAISDMLDVIRANKSDGVKSVLVLTDETDQSYFASLGAVYDLVHFAPVSDQLSPIEQAVAEMWAATYAVSFVGTMYSTMSGYINQLRREEGKGKTFRYLYSQHPSITLTAHGELPELPFGRYEWNRLALSDDLRASNNWWHRWSGCVADDRFRDKPVCILPDGVSSNVVEYLRTAATSAADFHQQENRYTSVITGKDGVMGLCMAKLDNTFTLSGRADFQFQLFRQLTGGKVNPHCDSLAPQDGTRRIASVLIYVNDDYEGGELTFDGLEHPFTIKPSPGMVIAYPILNEWNEHDPTFRHSAAEVTKGEKIMGYFSLRG